MNDQSLVNPNTCDDPNAPYDQKDARDTAAQAVDALSEQEAIMRFFAFSHLPGTLRDVSFPFAQLAVKVMSLPRSAERTVALRKLLESKDAAVRAAL